MNNLIKVLSIFFLIFISLFIRTFNHNEFIFNIFITALSAIYIFFKANNINNERHYVTKYILIYFIWNMTYLSIKHSLNDFNNLIDTLLLKNVYLDILPSLALICIFIKISNNKKYLNVIFSLVFLILFIFTKNNIFLYSAIGITSNIINLSLKYINNKFLNTISEYNLGIYIFHKEFIRILLAFELLKYNNFIDLIGCLILIYMLCTIMCYFIKRIPIIRNII